MNNERAELIRRLEQASHRTGELFARHQGKGWPEAASQEFTRLRDETIPELRAALLAADAQAGGEAAAHLDAMLTNILNRRVAVEQELFDMAAGKKPMPDAAKLRELALKLGDPEHSTPQPAAPEQGETHHWPQQGDQTWPQPAEQPVAKWDYVYPQGTTPQPSAQDKLRALANNFQITGPDDDGLVWLVLHGNGTTGHAMFNLGSADKLACQVALLLEADRRAALTNKEAS